MKTPERELSPSACVEDALWRAAERILDPGALDRRALTAAIAARSRRYTRDRARLTDSVAPRRRGADLAARALFFSVCDSPKPAVPIFELAGRGALPDPCHNPMRILDLGAGSGGTTLGTLDALRRAGAPPSTRAEILAIDRDGEALALLEAAAQEPPWRELASVETLRADALGAAWGGGPFDLVLAGGVLNELDEAQAAGLLRRAMASIAPAGAVIAIEPALRETARGLHRLRDLAIAEGAHVFAPCTRRRAPCPALADPRDWCHEDRPIRLPGRARALADATGLRERGAKFAYLVLRREEASLVDADGGVPAMRVVSSLRKQKGASECFVCGELGRVRLRRLKRDRSAENRAFDRVRRGDVLAAPEEALKAGRVGAADRVERAEPASPARAEGAESAEGAQGDKPAQLSRR